MVFELFGTPDWEGAKHAKSRALSTVSYKQDVKQAQAPAPTFSDHILAGQDAGRDKKRDVFLAQAVAMGHMEVSTGKQDAHTKWVSQQQQRIEAERVAQYTAHMEALRLKGAESPFRSKQRTAAHEVFDKHRQVASAMFSPESYAQDGDTSSGDEESDGDSNVDDAKLEGEKQGDQGAAEDPLSMSRRVVSYTARLGLSNRWRAQPLQLPPESRNTELPPGQLLTGSPGSASAMPAPDATIRSPSTPSHNARSPSTDMPERGALSPMLSRRVRASTRRPSVEMPFPPGDGSLLGEELSVALLSTAAPAPPAPAPVPVPAPPATGGGPASAQPVLPPVPRARRGSTVTYEDPAASHSPPANSPASVPPAPLISKVRQVAARRASTQDLTALAAAANPAGGLSLSSTVPSEDAAASPNSPVSVPPAPAISKVRHAAARRASTQDLAALAAAATPAGGVSLGQRLPVQASSQRRLSQISLPGNAQQQLDAVACGMSSLSAPLERLTLSGLPVRMSLDAVAGLGPSPLRCSSPSGGTPPSPVAAQAPVPRPPPAQLAQQQPSPPPAALGPLQPPGAKPRPPPLTQAKPSAISCIADCHMPDDDDGNDGNDGSDGSDRSAPLCRPGLADAALPTRGSRSFSQLQLGSRRSFSPLSPISPIPSSPSGALASPLSPSTSPLAGAGGAGGPALKAERTVGGSGSALPLLPAIRSASPAILR